MPLSYPPSGLPFALMGGYVFEPFKKAGLAAWTKTLKSGFWTLPWGSSLHGGHLSWGSLMERVLTAPRGNARAYCATPTRQHSGGQPTVLKSPASSSGLL